MKHIIRVGYVYCYRLRIPQDILTRFLPSKELKRTLKIGVMAA